MYSLGKSGGEWCHCVYLLNGNLHYFSYTQPYSYPVWNNFISTQTHTCTHWSVKEINKRHMLYVFHTHSLKHGNMKLRNSFSTTKLCPNSQVFSPSFQQYQETRSPHRKITTKQVYRTWLLPLLFVIPLNIYLRSSACHAFSFQRQFAWGYWLPEDWSDFPELEGKTAHQE